MIKYLFLIFTSAFFFSNSFCQKNNVVPDVEELLKTENFKEVNRLCKERISNFFVQKNADTISAYINYLGKSGNALKGETAAKADVLGVVQKAKNNFPDNKALVKIYLEAASFFSNSGNHQLAYDLVTQLDNYFANKRAVIAADIPAIQSNLGDYSMRMGKYAIASDHYIRSIQFLKTDPKPDEQKLYFANNSLGIVMWYSSRLDSAIFYWNKAIEALNKLEATPLNRNFRVALVQNNIAGCLNVLGKTQEAIDMFEQVIDNNKKFIASPEPHPKKENSRINQFQAIDNLAKVYLELGDFTKAHDLLNYSYQQKLKTFGDKSPEVYKSLIFLATIYNNQHNYPKAKTYLLDAINRIKTLGDIENSWGAEAYTQLAVAAKGLKNNSEAAAAYHEADRIYDIVYQGQYDDLYLSYLGGQSLFYADNNEGALAISSVTKGLHYVNKSQGENSLAAILQLKNLAEVNFRLKNYAQVFAVATKGLSILNKLAPQSSDLLDSIKISMEQPALVLLKSKAAYKLQEKKDTAFLNALLKELYEARNVVDKRKGILYSEKDITSLMAGYRELLDFIKKLNYELYAATGKTDYLDKMIGSHEQAMYARIRSRMDKQRAIRFSQVPASIMAEEARLRESIRLALQGKAAHDEKIKAYIAAVNSWNDYQQMLREKYPAYYEMRYGTKEKNVAALSQSIPAGITVLRYFFTGPDLFVLVATRQKQQLIVLPTDRLTENVLALNDPRTAPAQAGEAGFNLYNQLWKPVEKLVGNNRVMIIPDDILYNITFDMLVPERVDNYRDLAKKALVNKYAISYYYSLLALNEQKPVSKMKASFIGFSPEFSDEQKKVYSELIKNDSLHADNTYLSLLPLPFTTSLVREVHDNLGGEIFLNDRSTPEAFRTHAGNHTIIYIGTHAEANNNYPEFSRLIFAKDPQKASGENSLYLFDIYNCDLSSDLVILTACESGKAGYQDGEGMVSMAHAFSYAGSQSILTGLWKIDEQSSTIITDHFYKNLLEGMTKDEALRQAKLKYLSENEGRMLAPKYWAGLVIMGDTSPVVLPRNKKTLAFWMAGGLFLVLLMGILYYRRRKKG
ncbi:CHAT domain-containing protein [Ferruginibacter sp. HRS2-29]|uniref:CHAT domain-containing protein n=1 Tax=Ferruginibacter sp. HRS2-29 TaxID=2487334 RepID=UPI0020CE192B|nr:CHAT domain-containing tetratricopeptide repeat protein [Ferruginibacter sp. HRS2-29]MCP9750145.1 CHAT domain-containing protein [Ferruginibacter sp. HRS2-29]